MLRCTWLVKTMQEANIFKSLLACLNARATDIDAEFFLNRFYAIDKQAELAVRSKSTGVVSSVYSSRQQGPLAYGNKLVSKHSAEHEKNLFTSFVAFHTLYLCFSLGSSVNDYWNLCFSLSSSVNDCWTHLDVRDLESSSVEELGLKLSMQGF